MATPTDPTLTISVVDSVARDGSNQPVDNIEWVARDDLRANDYNPNKVFSPELGLLKLSILEDGWTQPIVALRDGTIVDGFHRWTVAGDPRIASLTSGMVPVVYIDPDPAQQRMATVRHNRARGHHHVVKMADIVVDLIDSHGVSREDVMTRLGMEREEVDRLYQRGEMVKRGARAEFNKGWVPK